MHAILDRSMAEMPAARQDLAVEGLAAGLDRLAGCLLRYGLVAILLYLGAFKFSRTEAEAIQPLLANSPLLSWLYGFMSIQAASMLIGSTELVIAVLLALRPVQPRLAALGSLMAMGMFLTTLSFLVTTPGAFASVPDFPLPAPGAAGGFLMKDLFLLGAATWSAGEAIRAGKS